MASKINVKAYYIYTVVLQDRYITIKCLVRATPILLVENRFIIEINIKIRKCLELLVLGLYQLRENLLSTFVTLIQKTYSTILLLIYTPINQSQCLILEEVSSLVIRCTCHILYICIMYIQTLWKVYRLLERTDDSTLILRVPTR